MNKIKLLPLDQAQKIAAGEVVERPANIVKELIENALDAQASQISLYVEQAGKQLIRIVDNGCGMSPTDAEICFLPHATSKITSIDQLTSISSFGFRGEALASIAAVSKVTLITKQANEQSGTYIAYAENMLQEKKEMACNNGTDLSVADLFYNIPVRKKFLKQDETEWNQIQALVNAFCLNHPTIGFKLFHDNRLILNAPAIATIKDRFIQLWDVNFAQNLLPLDQPTHLPAWLSVTGFISNHHFWRHGKQHIFFFVNNRWIKNPELSKSLVKGYYNVLPPGKFPAACIMLTIDKNLVDINCHPKKEEVRFTKPGTVETAITTLVKQTLEQSLNQKIERTATATHHIDDIKNSHINQPQQLPSWHQAAPHVTHAPVVIDKHPQPAPSQATATSVEMPQVRAFQPMPINIKQPIKAESNPEPTMIPTGPIIGQLFKTYILIDNDEELILIDQHAAHERILYEKFLKNFEHKAGTLLLFPEIIQLTKQHLTFLMAEKDFFAHQGLELEQISATEIIIKTAPPQLQQGSLKDFIFEAIAFIEEHEQLDREIFRKKLNEHVHSHMACKAAIKAGDSLTLEQMQKLMNDLYQTEKRFICIHGRPTMWNIRKDEIEKHFRRH